MIPKTEIDPPQGQMQPSKHTRITLTTESTHGYFNYYVHSPIPDIFANNEV